MPATTFTVPHDLTREEAASRLLAGVPKLESLIPGGGSVKAERVGEHGMTLDIGVMGQTITVNSTLTDSAVEGTVTVPLMLAMMKGQIAEMVESSVARMLAKSTPADA